MGNCLGPGPKSSNSRSVNPDSHAELAKQTHCDAPPRLLNLQLVTKHFHALGRCITHRVPFAVNIDEVYALEQLYKDVSNSLHQVMTRRCIDSHRLSRCPMLEGNCRLLRPRLVADNLQRHSIAGGSGPVGATHKEDC